MIVELDESQSLIPGNSTNGLFKYIIKICNGTSIVPISVLRYLLDKAQFISTHLNTSRLLISNNETNLTRPLCHIFQFQVKIQRKLNHFNFKSSLMRKNKFKETLGVKYQ